MEHWLLYGLSSFKIEGKKDVTTYQLKELTLLWAIMIGL
jgi:hypothetical protein